MNGPIQKVESELNPHGFKRVQGEGKSYIGMHAAESFIILLCCVVLSAGCGYQHQKLSYTDPLAQQLLRATETATVHRFGFTPVLPSDLIRLEKSSRSYGLMLHIYGRTSRTIGFRKDGDNYAWIHEQEIYQGPKQYTDVDGTFYESLSLTYELQRVAHFKRNKLNIHYSGEDSRLVHPFDLTLETILPVLKEWGYDIEQIGAENSNLTTGAEPSQRPPLSEMSTTPTQ